ncbi:MAG: DUF1844 domain-containing protein [Verrucomicrobiota bacterium]
MNPPSLNEDALRGASVDEIHSALFEQLVAGHAQMALMFLGEIPHPETGHTAPPSIENAKMFIDQLEMLESRTRGNLSAAESRVLTQALRVTRKALASVMDAVLEEDPAPPVHGLPRDATNS